MKKSFLFLVAATFTLTTAFAQQGGAPDVVKKNTGGKAVPASTAPAAVKTAETKAPTEKAPVKKAKKAKKAVKKAKATK